MFCIIGRIPIAIPIGLIENENCNYPHNCPVGDNGFKDGVFGITFMKNFTILIFALCCTILCSCVSVQHGEYITVTVIPFYRTVSGGAGPLHELDIIGLPVYVNY